ncbi:hypothetical protein [Streptomyces sp. NRRL WC-3549]|uniref:hypothetical protein n=1 Tax=Streptomyces sp. NRRL WC-3549 TaxID=1463925 RepID=UPI0004CB914A|nr:hypothetical protein [Streptomyces sp. NRRL WC-3549]
MVTGKFIADPGRIRRGGEMMEALPERTNKIADNFVSDIQNYRGWAGHSDDFAHQVLPKFDANNEACLALIRAVGTALAELRHAVWANGQHIEGVSAYASEQIGRQATSLDGLGGGTAGGGRH